MVDDNNDNNNKNDNNKNAVNNVCYANFYNPLPNEAGNFQEFPG